MEMPLADLWGKNIRVHARATVIDDPSTERPGNHQKHGTATSHNALDNSWLNWPLLPAGHSLPCENSKGCQSHTEVPEHQGVGFFRMCGHGVEGQKASRNSQPAKSRAREEQTAGGPGGRLTRPPQRQQVEDHHRQQKGDRKMN